MTGASEIMWNGFVYYTGGRMPEGFPYCWWNHGHENTEHPAVWLFTETTEAGGDDPWTFAVCQECYEKEVIHEAVEGTVLFPRDVVYPT